MIVVVVAGLVGAGARGLWVGTSTSGVAPVTPDRANRPQPRDARTEHGAIAETAMLSSISFSAMRFVR